MRVSDLDLIFVPELGALSPDHWIARWSAKLSTARVVMSAEPEAAVEAVVSAAARRPFLLIGHSTGAVAIALAAERLKTAVGAFLVAPPDDATLSRLDGGRWPRAPRAPLPWPSLLVASRTDPWASLPDSAALAADWRATLIDAGEAGRIDADSGHGPWPDGLLRLGGLLKTLA